MLLFHARDAKHWVVATPLCLHPIRRPQPPKNRKTTQSYRPGQGFLWGKRIFNKSELKTRTLPAVRRPNRNELTNGGPENAKKENRQIQRRFDLKGVRGLRDSWRLRENW
jgi:hypothetical protein